MGLGRGGNVHGTPDVESGLPVDFKSILMQTPVKEKGSSERKEDIQRKRESDSIKRAIKEYYRTTKVGSAAAIQRMITAVFNDQSQLGQRHFTRFLSASFFFQVAGKLRNHQLHGLFQDY
mmetsp:Transcript_35110/g.104805  ORF Transcript_35110/g.104805 Transcript_35110/m.104805 type:complete len:120 (-) Transcript_35110:1864-2223(-)